MNTKYISTTLAVLAIVLATVSAQSCANGVCSSSKTYCQQANDCGTVPYGDCNKPNSCFYNPGVVLDTVEKGVLYYSEICFYGPYNNQSVTLNQAYKAGSVPTVITTTFNLTAPLLLGRQNNQILNAVGNGVPFIYGYSSSDGSVTKYPLPQGYNTITALTSDPIFYYAVLFLPGTGYQIVKFANPLSTESNIGTVVYTLSSSASTYPSADTPPFVARGANYDLYFNVGDNVYKGDAKCIQCSLPYPIRQISGINSFTYARDGNLYLATTNGLIKYLPGANQVTLVSGNIQGVTVDDNRVFYNTFTAVASIDFLGGNAYQVTKADPGVCVCRSGFSGNDCKTCNGQIVWGSDGYPSCVRATSSNERENVQSTPSTSTPSTSAPSTSTPSTSAPSTGQQLACSGQVITTARPNGNWVSGNTFYQIYDISVKNNGRCPVTRALYDIVYITGGAGGSPAGVSQAWNVEVVNGQASPNPIQLFGGVASGATLSGAGIVVYNSTSSYEAFHGPNVFCDAECINQ